MAITDSNSNLSDDNHGNRAEATLDRLVFAALNEQTRARRWRIFFLLFFVIYLTVITIILLQGRGDGLGAENKDGKHTALVRLSGVIASGEKAGAENIISGLKAAFEHENTSGIVLEINSPGGSPVQSAYIFDEIRRLREEHKTIPIYAVVADIAASGGYYVAAAADKILVNQSSLVGSIGVRMDAFGFVEMMKKLGIERRLLVAGDNKGLFDPFLPEQSEQKAHLQSMLNQVHKHFIAAVKLGRGDRLVESPEIFSGLIWSGDQAINLGLVDEYGNTRSAARGFEAEKIIDFTPKSNLLERFAEQIGSSAGQSISETLFGGLAIN